MNLNLTNQNIDINILKILNNLLIYFKLNQFKISYLKSKFYFI